MTINFKALVGSELKYPIKLTEGRFYHVIDSDGEHVVIKARTPGATAAVANGEVVELVAPCKSLGRNIYRLGDTCAIINNDATVLGRRVFKFTPRPDTVVNRGQRVKSQDDVTIGRWYILIDRNGDEYRGQCRETFSRTAVFSLDEESVNRRPMHVRSFLVEFGNGREVYKFKTHPDNRPGGKNNPIPATAVVKRDDAIDAQSYNSVSAVQNAAHTSLQLLTLATSVGILANKVDESYAKASEAIEAHKVASEAYQQQLAKFLEASKLVAKNSSEAVAAAKV